MQHGVWGWDSVNSAWVKMLVDAAGNLQVDVVASGLPAGGATAANQATMVTALQLIDNLVGALGSVNTDDLQVDVKTIADGQIRCYGWDSANWQKLTVGAPADAFATPGVALEVMSFLMGYDGSDWNMLRCDAAGHLQVDVVGAGATEAHAWGYDGSLWQELMVESAVLQNLRVKLYDGATGIDSFDMTLAYYVPTGKHGLACVSMATLWHNTGVLEPMHCANQITEESVFAPYPGAAIMGFDGTYYRFLRVYTGGVIKVGRAAVGLLTARKTATGQVGAAGARKLFWITMNPSAAASIVELTDAVAGGGTVIWDMRHGVNSAHHMNMDPPMEFATGIYLETFTNFTSIVFGYL